MVEISTLKIVSNELSPVNVRFSSTLLLAVALNDQRSSDPSNAYIVLLMVMFAAGFGFEDTRVSGFWEVAEGAGEGVVVEVWFTAGVKAGLPTVLK